MKNILYYISGHGYGHATRSIEIINYLIAHTHNVHVHIKTYAPQWLFHALDNSRTHFWYLKHDVGAIQNNSFYADKKATLEAYADFINSKPEVLQSESEFIHENHIDLIISDISPIAFEIAEKSKLPSIAIGNFSWDWIYKEWLQEFPQFKFVLDDIETSYKKADVLLRLPFYGDMSVFKEIVDVAVVGRKANQSSIET